MIHHISSSPCANYQFSMLYLMRNVFFASLFKTIYRGFNVFDKSFLSTRSPQLSSPDLAYQQLTLLTLIQEGECFPIQLQYYLAMDKQSSYPTIKDFVLQEAHEKAFERLVMGLKEYEREKGKIISEKKEVLHSEFEKKHKDNAALRRINKSTKINESRMKKMNARHENLQQLVISAEQRLAKSICRNEKTYSDILRQLILEGLIKLLEPVVYVRCLQKDKNLISRLLPQCKREFQQIIAREGIDSAIGQVDLRLDERYSLIEKNVDTNTSRIKKSEESNICFGGVIMTNEDGLIVCKNTIDARLELAYQSMLPIIRKTLYDE